MLIEKLKDNKTLLFVLFLLSAVAYYLFAYKTTRTDFGQLLALYSFLFFCFWGIYSTQKNNFLLLALIAMSFRFIFINSTPELSQDFYRFIWDGRMILNGINPYLFTPEFFIKHGNYPIPQALELFNGMGELNASHYTNYPPIKQLSFTLAHLFSSESIIANIISMRVQLILADIGVLYFGKKLLQQLKLPSPLIFLYLLNPFIIIELSVNLHYEGLMLFFIIWSIYLLHIEKWKWAAVVLACAVSVKLIPLLFLPLLFQRFPIKKLIAFYSLVFFSTFLLFIPFFSMAFVNNYTETVGLWFQNFEFNASIYYIAREIGYWLTGYNQIAVIGKILPLIVFLIIIAMAIFRRNYSTQQLISAMLLSLSIYFFFSTTIHPWYIASLVLLSVFTRYRFPIAWSFLIILSYSAYQNETFQENLWLVALQYTIVYTIFFWELFCKKKQENVF